MTYRSVFRPDLFAGQVVASHGRIDGLVNNAGGRFPAPLEAITARGWQAVLATNLTGGFLVARECYVQSMKLRGGAAPNARRHWPMREGAPSPAFEGFHRGRKPRIFGE